MKSKIHRRILVVFNLTYQSGREQLDGYFRYADCHGNWDTLVVPSTDESYGQMTKSILKRGIDGAIVKSESTESFEADVFAADIPVVAIDRPRISRPYNADAYVVNDNERIGREAARHFDSLGRFASYGFVPQEDNREWSHIRGAAFRAAVKERQRDAKVSERRGPLADWLAALPKPAAVFAAFDMCAADIIETCHELHLKVPKDVAVIGVDNDTTICEHTKPKLTSIRPDHVGQGFAAAKELDRLLSGKAKRRDFITCPPIGISERDSTAAVPPGVHIVREANAYLDKHALEPIRVADVVSSVRVSAKLANLRYSEATGHSIQAELVARRLAEVKRLLSGTDWPMTRIAMRCGFKSQTVLANLFSSHFGMSMSAYRRNQGVQRVQRVRAECR